MRTLIATIVCLLAVALHDGLAFAADAPRASTVATKDANAWRMVYRQGKWWYWTPQNTWLTWNGQRCVGYTAPMPSASRPTATRAYSYQPGSLASVPYPTPEQVNSAGMTGLGYDGLPLGMNRSRRVVRSFSRQPSGGMPDEAQVNSAGTTGLGYDDLDIPESNGGVGQVLTSDQSYQLPPYIQVNSAGTTGLGYEGLR